MNVNLQKHYKELLKTGMGLLRLLSDVMQLIEEEGVTPDD